MIYISLIYHIKVVKRKEYSDVLGRFLYAMFIFLESLSPNSLHSKNTMKTKRKCLYDYVLNTLGVILLSANKKEDLIPHQ